MRQGWINGIVVQVTDRGHVGSSVNVFFER